MEISRPTDNHRRTKSLSCFFFSNQSSTSSFYFRFLLLVKQGSNPPLLLFPFLYNRSDEDRTAPNRRCLPPRDFRPSNTHCHCPPFPSLHSRRRWSKQKQRGSISPLAIPQPPIDNLGLPIGPLTWFRTPFTDQTRIEPSPTDLLPIPH